MMFVVGSALAPILMMGSALVAPAEAQVPPVQPPAFLTTDNSANWEPGQLLWREVGLGRTTVVVYHNGIFYAGAYAGSPYDTFEWSDWNDASSVTITNRVGSPGYVNVPIETTQGTHGSGGKVGDWVLPGVKRTSTAGVNTNQTYGELFWSQQGRPPGGSGFHNLYYPWRLGFEWPQYGGQNGLNWVWRADQYLGEYDAGAETGVFGHTLMVGNLLILCSDETNSGVAIYDMRPMFQNPPQPPQLLDKLAGQIGGYLPAIWRNYVTFPTNGGIHLIDYSDPSNLVYSDFVTASGGGGQEYIQFQDEFAFYQKHKINLETGQVELTLDWEDNGNRPPGSVSGRLNTTQYLMPLGNLLITGGNGNGGQDGVGVWVHQDEPDTTRPSVGYHIPRPNQTNYPVGAPISLLIHEVLESYTIINGETVILHEVGDPTPIDCFISFSHDDILTVTPRQYLEEDTEYVVEIVDNGIKDAAGNGIVGLSFNFSTGSSSSGNQPPVIDDVVVSPAPAEPGTPVGITVSASDPEGTATLEYRVNYGDGSTVTPWTAGATNYTHTYTDPGHYEVKVQVREQNNPSLLATEVLVLTAVTPVTGPLPTKSSPLALDAANQRVWVVNPDNDTVTRLNSATEAVELEVDLASLVVSDGTIDPRSLAIDSSGNVWVACRDADLLVILDGQTGAAIASVDLGYGSAPVGVAISRDGASAFVTTEARGHEAATTNGSDPANGRLLRYDTSSYGIGVAPTETGSLELGPMARAIAVFGDGERVLVTRFITGHPRGGEVWDVDASSASSLSLAGTIYLTMETGTIGQGVNEDSSDGAGVPNYVSSITISPDEQWAWYTATKPDTGRGNLFGTFLDPDNTVRAMVGRIHLGGSNPQDADGSRIDFDNADSPTAVAFSPNGDWAFVTVQGNNLFGVFDQLDIANSGSAASRITRARIESGLAPQGLVVDPGTNKLWVKNFMERTVSVHDMTEFFERGAISDDKNVVSTVGAEALSPAILNGKQIFYDADNMGRMSDEAYISCATCHVDGMHDGMTWDFTQRGEGLRNTTDLRGRGGMDHGNVHWTANFDEIQDFENDIRFHFGGQGLMTDPDFDASEDPLGSPKAGRSIDLDDLAAYVSSLEVETLPKSPYRGSDGTRTASADTGAGVFAAQNCASCHDPASDYTDSVVGDGLASLHDVGSLRASSGTRIGAPLTGIDTPTLLGLWASAPYFHDGTATALDDTFAASGGTTLQAEDATLLGGADVRNLQQANSVSGAEGGEAVRANGVGKGAEWANVDGGSGGVARLEFKYAAPGNGGTFEVTVNGGTPIPVSFAQTQAGGNDAGNWRIAAVDANLLAGASNKIGIVSIAGGGYLDWLHVATVDDFAQADAHTRVAGLAAGDYDALVDYLLQLDGRDEAGALPRADVVDWTARWTFDNTDAEETGSNLTLNRQAGAGFDADASIGTHSLLLDGTSDWSAINNTGNSPLELAFSNHTISLWFKADDLSGTQLLFEEGGGTNGIAVRLNGTSIEAAVRNGGAGSQRTVSIPGVTAGAWQYAAVVFDGAGSSGTLRLHLNGGAPAEVATPYGTISNHSSDPGIGRSNSDSFGGGSGDFFGGRIDDLRVYGRALSTEEVTIVFSGEIPMTPILLTDDNAAVDEGSSVDIDVLANDQGDELSVILLSDPAYGSASSDGTLVTYTPGAGQYGQYGADAFTYRVRDAHGGEATGTVTVTTNPTQTAQNGIGGFVHSAAGGVDSSSREMSSGAWQVQSDGLGLGDLNDSFAWDSQSLSGDFQVVVRLEDLAGPSTARAGIMLREGSGDDVRFVALGSGTGDGYVTRTRLAAGGAAGAEGTPAVGGLHAFPNKWLLLQRVGNLVTLAVSEADGPEYESVDQHVLAGLSDSVEVGLYVSSGADAVFATATFDGWTLTPIAPKPTYYWVGPGNNSGQWSGQELWDDGSGAAPHDPTAGNRYVFDRSAPEVQDDGNIGGINTTPADVFGGDEFVISEGNAFTINGGGTKTVNLIWDDPETAGQVMMLPGGGGMTLAGSFHIPDDVADMPDGPFTIESELSGWGELRIRRRNSASTRHTNTLANGSLAGFEGTLRVGAGHSGDRDLVTVDFDYDQVDPNFDLIVQQGQHHAMIRLDQQVAVKSATFLSTTNPTVELADGVYDFAALQAAGVGAYFEDGGGTLYVGQSIPAPVYYWVGPGNNQGNWAGQELWDNGSGAALHEPTAGNIYVVDASAAEVQDDGTIGGFNARNGDVFGGDSLRITGNGTVTFNNGAPVTVNLIYDDLYQTGKTMLIANSLHQEIGGTFQIPDDVADFPDVPVFSSTITGNGELKLRRRNSAATRETASLTNDALSIFTGTLRIGQGHGGDRDLITVDFDYDQLNPTFDLIVHQGQHYAKLRLDQNIAVDSAEFRFDGGGGTVLASGAYSYADLVSEGVGDFIEDGGGKLFVGKPVTLDTTPSIVTTTLPDALLDQGYAASVSATGGEAPLSWSLGGGAPGWLSIDTATGDLSGTPGVGDLGQSSFDVTVTDDDGDFDSRTFDLAVVQPPAQLVVSEWSGASALSPEDGWVNSGDLANGYTSPVVIASLAQDPSQPPAVAMVRLVSGSDRQYEIKIEQPTGAAVPTADYDVSVLVVEAGSYVGWEAGTLTSTVTDRKSNWNGQQVNFANTYTAPVIIGQVVVAAGSDPEWSAFWSGRDNNGSVDRNTVATGDSAFIGKHVGEDSSITRPNATLGYLVVESGAATIDGANAVAALSGTNVRHARESGGPVTLDFASSGFGAISGALACQTTMRGNDGSWSVLVEPNAINGTDVTVGVMEDEVGDSDDGHIDENVSVLIFE